VSYSQHDSAHSQRVQQLAQALTEDGIDSDIDQFHRNEMVDWSIWSAKNLTQADYVLMVCSSEYRRRIEGQVPADIGRGVYLEGRLIARYLYDNKANDRFVPVLLDDEPESSIPILLGTPNYFRLYAFGLKSLDEGYRNLYRLVTHQPSTPKRPLGPIVDLSRSIEDKRHEPPAEPRNQLPPARRAVAIFPFICVGCEPGTRDIAAGLPLELDYHLRTQVPGITTVDWETMSTAEARYGSNQLEIARRLMAACLVQGAFIMSSSDECRVAIDVQETEGQQQHFAQEWRFKVDTLNAARSVVRDEVTYLIDRVLVSGEVASHYRRTTSIRAYQAFLAGVTKYLQLNRQDMPKARSFFEEAIREDDRYRAAYTLLGWVHAQSYRFSLVTNSSGALEKALAYQRQASRLTDEDDPLCPLLLAYIQLLQGEFDRAEVAANELVDKFPRNDVAVAIAAEILVCTGAVVRARECINDALEMSPIKPSWYFGTLGEIHRLCDEYSEAIEALQQHLARAPRVVLSRIRLIDGLIHSNRQGDALHEGRYLRESSPAFSVADFVSDWGRRALPYRDQQELVGLAASLRAAGLS